MINNYARYIKHNIALADDLCAVLTRSFVELMIESKWSGRLDSNQRPLAPHASALPSCATPRAGHYNSDC